MGNFLATISSSNTTKMSDLKQFIESENSKHQVVVWSKSSCGYCARTNQLFQSMPNVDLVIHQLDQRSDGSQIQAVLQQMTKQGTVPNVFVNNQHVGGNSDVQAAHKNGSLQKLLNKK
ncbi:glutaredoxin [Mayamaea pseudoterrestris]|nr:glutaredoxin [Mayamaea pseudoterrestris]